METPSGNERIGIDLDQIQPVQLAELPYGCFLFVGAGIFQTLFLATGITAITDYFIAG